MWLQHGRQAVLHRQDQLHAGRAPAHHQDAKHPRRLRRLVVVGARCGLWVAVIWRWRWGGRGLLSPFSSSSFV